MTDQKFNQEEFEREMKASYKQDDIMNGGRKVSFNTSITQDQTLSQYLTDNGVDPTIQYQNLSQLMFGDGPIDRGEAYMETCYDPN